MGKWIAVVQWTSYDTGGASVYEVDAGTAAEAADKIAPLMLVEEQAEDDVVWFGQVAEVCDGGSVEVAARRALAAEKADETQKARKLAEDLERAELARLKAKYEAAK